MNYRQILSKDNILLVAAIVAALLALCALFAQAIADTLVSGAGFTGPTSEPLGIGPKAIARWDVVPHQTFKTLTTLGIVAFHKDGISRVEMSLENGPWLPIYYPELNTRTGVIEYSADMDPAGMPDGPVEVRAIAYPLSGSPRLLPSLFLNVNASNSLPEISKYVSTTGNDQTGDGTESNPYQSILRAARAVQDEVGTGNADGGIVYLLAGEHIYGTYSYQYLTTTVDRWLTVKPAPGVSRADAELIYSMPGGLRTKLVHLDGITIRTVLTTNGPLEDYLWIENSLMWGYGRTTQVSSVGWAGPTHWTEFYATDTVIKDHRRGLINAKLQRNVDILNIGSDAYTNTMMVLNCTVDGIDNSGTSWHPDVYQFSGTGQLRENIVVYGLKALNSQAQGIFADDLSSIDNAAFVNVLIHGADNYLSQWINVQTDHLLLWHVTLTDQPFKWSAASLTNSSVGGNCFYKAIGGIPANTNMIASNHYTVSGGIEPGSDVSTGDPQFVNSPQLDFRPQSTSPLVTRVNSLLALDDLARLLRSTPSSIGAYEPGSTFIRGDANHSGWVNLADAMEVSGAISYGIPTNRNSDAYDANDDGAIDINDPTYLLMYLFSGGAAPPLPFPNPGPDPTPDSL